ncbi:multidrug efflux MFS transporter [Ollibium composti]|uniref:Multidrug efflux MFS transporter n=1 Tax=Ollibium composti TaxID=2675109 RepID=A0ABY2QBY9_9HYPH|nr:multidrug efflux MFS transporter [Mesorhizobium composti]THF59803.1 multidrug efflux MFS transporter [Mesorhizobium composti]
MAQSETTGQSAYNVHWRRNLVVCLLGSFTTIVAMTLLLPFLPLYVEELGATGHAAIVQWSGIAYGATFLAAALVAPLWGKLGDRYGRKLILVRASLGMAICMSLTGMVQSVWQLVLLRLLIGFAGGYSSGSTILVAMQTPKDRSGWALGTLSAGIMAGNLVGPLVGGALPPLIGIRATFLLAGGVIFLAFLATSFLIKEDAHPAATKAPGGKAKSGWSQIPDKRPVTAMLATGMLLMFATMSIEPIITVYVGQFVEDQSHVTLVSGVVMSAAALGAILSASYLGRLADRIGHWTVIAGALAAAALLLIPQAFVTAGWQLVALRFLMGLALGGLLPSVTSVIRHNVPDGVGGNVLGLSVSAQYVGQVAGPLLGGFVGGHFGMRAVFLMTAVLMAAGAVYNWLARASQERRSTPDR